MSFKQNGYEVVRNAISNELLEHLKIEFEMFKEIKFYKHKETNLYAFGDEQSPNSFSIYSLLCFESLAIQLRDSISKITQKNLYPTYSFARIYYNGAILKPHTDRPSCEYSTTICIDTTDMWNFHIKDRIGNENVVKLNPGDMCVYSGCELEHWRDPYTGTQQIQCFLHYVDSNGPFKNFKYDKRPMLGIVSSMDNTKDNFNYF